MNWEEALKYLREINLPTRSYNIAVGFIMSRKTYSVNYLFFKSIKETEFIIENAVGGNGIIIKTASNRLDYTIIYY